MNSVNLIGRLTRDPEARATGTGTSVSNMRIAVPKRKRNGEEQPPNYVTVIAYSGLADVCNAHLVEGREVSVTGRLEQREYDKDGSRREVIEVVADTIDFLRPAKSNQSPSGDPDEALAGVGAGADEDIPF